MGFTVYLAEAINTPSYGVSAPALWSEKVLGTCY